MDSRVRQSATADPPSLEGVVERVGEVVRDIPPGCVMTYGDVGALVGVGPRQVGRVMATGCGDVPWWRVTNAQGLLPEHLRGDAFEAYAREGTPVRGDRVVLRVARWWPEEL